MNNNFRDFLSQPKENPGEGPLLEGGKLEERLEDSINKKSGRRNERNSSVINQTLTHKKTAGLSGLTKRKSCGHEITGVRGGEWTKPSGVRCNGKRT